MREFILPPSFFAFSQDELDSLFQLPWKEGTLGDLPSGDYLFLLNQGELKTENGIIVNPGERLHGILPFFKNRKEKYHSFKNHLIAFLETRELARYFLQRPKALQSFVKYLENFGNEPLSSWQHFPRTWLFSTTQKPGWHSIHLALCAGVFLAEAEARKVLYLELSPQGLSVFSFLRKEPSPSLLQVEDPSRDLKSIINERITTFRHVDILNINHLAHWELTPQEWFPLYWELVKRYDHIIIHTGEADPGFLAQECDSIFLLRDCHPPHLEYLHPDQNNKLWPPIFEIFTDALPGRHDRRLYYPLYYKSLVDIAEIPVPDEKENPYWQWFEQNIKKILTCKQAAVLGESIGNNIDPDRIWENSLPQAGYDSYADFLSKNIVIAEGTSLLWSALQHMALKTRKPGMEGKIHTIVQKVIGSLTPIYPKSGFFSRKSFLKKIPSDLEKINQGYAGLLFCAYSKERENIHWFSCGDLIDNLIEASLPPGMLDHDETAKFYATDRSLWLRQIALAFRFGFKEIDFYDFKIELDSPGGLAERLIKDFAAPRIAPGVSGLHSTHYLVRKIEPVPEKTENSEDHESPETPKSAPSPQKTA